ncbi:MAG: hypothetical protein ACRDPH_13525 [Marmoricola sp.]
MTASGTLERRYRRLLALYSRDFRREREDEMLTVLMAGARDGQRWPRPAEVVNLLYHAAPSRLRQGPPPGSFARRHPRGVITTRILVGIWLMILTALLCRYSLWALFMLVFVALHAYLAARTAAFMNDEGGGEPPSAISAGH